MMKCESVRERKILGKEGKEDPRCNEAEKKLRRKMDGVKEEGMR